MLIHGVRRVLPVSNRIRSLSWRLGVLRGCASCASPPPRSQIPAKKPAPHATRSTSSSVPKSSVATQHETLGGLLDHRSLGVQQELFLNSPYSPGSPIFLPAGTLLFNRLVAFLRRQYAHYGFQEVLTPTMYKKTLWKKSGHLENYAEDMYTVTSMSPARAEMERHAAAIVAGADEKAISRGKEGENFEEEEVEIEFMQDAPHQEHGKPQAHAHATPTSAANHPSPDLASEEAEYGLKPMNCPGHCLIFGSKARSYTDLPIRLADFGALHRNEISGALSGLTRVRRFHQDDGHIFCRASQVEAEIRASLDFVRVAYSALRLGPYRLVLSTRPAEGHYMGDAAEWDRAEAALARALDHSVGKENWTLSPGDGAFYGPKIDIILTDRSGKEHQTATIQLDFQLPRRFELKYLTPFAEEADVDDPTPPAAKGVEVPAADDTIPSPPPPTATPTTPDPATTTTTTSGPNHTARPVMIHRAVLGSFERLLALLTEHTQARWPLWLNPRQILIATVNDTAPVLDFARSLHALLSGTPFSPSSYSASPQALPRPIRPSEETGLAVALDASARTLPLKIREAKQRHWGVIVVVGPKDVGKGVVVVDASGIPGAGEMGWDKKVEMTPEELLGFVTERVDRYE